MNWSLEDILALAFCLVLAVALANLYVLRWRKTALSIAILAALPLTAAFLADAWSDHAMHPLDAHSAPITAMAVSQDESLLAVADQSGSIRVTRTGSKALVYERRTEGAAIRALYFTTGIRANEVLLFAVDDRGEAVTFAAETGEELPVSIVPPQPQGQSPNQVAPQRSELANPRYIASAIDQDGAIAVLRAGNLGDLNVEESYELRVFGQLLGYSLSLPVRPASITSHAVDPATAPSGGARPFLIGFADGVVGLAWGGATPPVLVKQAADPNGAPGAPIVRLASSPDNTIVSVDAQGAIALWRLDPKTGEPVKQDFTAKANDLVLRVGPSRIGAVQSMAWGREHGELITLPAEGNGQVWDLATGRQTSTLNSVKVIAVSQDGSQLAAVLFDDTTTVWGTVTEQGTKVAPGSGKFVNKIAWSPDGSRLVTTSTDGVGRILDSVTGKEIATFMSREEYFEHVEWSPDGSRLATIANTPLKISTMRARVWDAKTGRELVYLVGHQRDLTSVAWCPDGTRIATASADTTARVWDASSGKEMFLLRGHEASVTKIVWSPSGEELATVSSDGTARIWNATNGNQVFVLRGHQGIVGTVAWSPDGSRLATASDDATVRIWNSTNGTEIAVLRGHENSVSLVLWNFLGTLLVSAADDGTVRIWDARADSDRALHCRACLSLGINDAGSIGATDSSGHSLRIDIASGRQQVSDKTVSPPGGALFVDDADLARLFSREDGSLKLTGIMFSGIDLPAQPAQSSHALFLTDGRIATGAIDGTVRLLDPAMQPWLDHFDVWPELMAVERWAVGGRQDAPRPAAFEQSIAFASQWDGEKLGIDQALYDALRGAAGRPSRHVSAMTPEEMRELAYENFWMPYADYKEPFARVLFDTALVMGRAKASEVEAEAIGGAAGEAVIANTKVDADPQVLVPRFLDLRLQRAATRSPERNQRTEERLRALAKSVGVQWTAKKAATTAQ